MGILERIRSGIKKAWNWVSSIAASLASFFARSFNFAHSSTSEIKRLRSRIERGILIPGATIELIDKELHPTSQRILSMDYEHKDTLSKFYKLFEFADDFLSSGEKNGCYDAGVFVATPEVKPENQNNQRLAYFALRDPARQQGHKDSWFSEICPFYGSGRLGGAINAIMRGGLESGDDNTIMSDMLKRYCIDRPSQEIKIYTEALRLISLDNLPYRDVSGVFGEDAWCALKELKSILCEQNPVVQVESLQSNANVCDDTHHSTHMSDTTATPVYSAKDNMRSKL